MSDKSSQTEKPTQKRLKKAREDGQFLNARELVNALHFLAFIVLLGSFGPAWFTNLRLNTQFLLRQAFDTSMTGTSITRMLQACLIKTLSSLAELGGILCLLTVVLQLALTQFGLSWKRLTPKIESLNPLGRLKRIPQENIPAFLQAAILLPVFGYLVYYIVREKMDSFARLPLSSVLTGWALVISSVENLLWRGGSLMLVFGLIHLVRQQNKYSRDLRMSKQEIKEEHKESDGHPHIKQKIRQLQRESRRRNMMREVPTATAVIVNPTHFAVAIRYEMNSMAAPKVVAKGKDHLALRIRKLAVEHQVPLIENPPLAQALYKTAEVGQEIPAHLYRAVAEILAYIYRLMNQRVPR